MSTWHLKNTTQYSIH